MGAGAGRSQGDLGWPRISRQNILCPLPRWPLVSMCPTAPHSGCGDAYVCACAVAASPQLSHWQGRPGRAAGCAGLAAGNYNVETRLIVYCVHTVHCVMCGGGSTAPLVDAGDLVGGRMRHIAPCHFNRAL